MFDPVTFVLAFGLLFSASLYVRAKRRRARARARVMEFDGGWRHDNGPRVTVIMSPHIRSVRGRK
jgi:hypothetical protein